MPRNPVQNMDVATDWVFGSKCRRLQREHPEAWTHYWCAYLALLAEAWRGMDREATMREAFPAAIPASRDDTIAALQSVGLLDDEARVTDEAWADRVAPAVERIAKRRLAGSIGGTAAASNRSTDAGAGAGTRSVPFRTEPIRTDPGVAASTTDSNPSGDDEGERPASMMGFRPKSKPGSHDGQHAPTCGVCHPENLKPTTVPKIRKDESGQYVVEGATE